MRQASFPIYECLLCVFLLNCFFHFLCCITYVLGMCRAKVKYYNMLCWKIERNERKATCTAVCID